jgi:hypothetical protein
MKFIAPYRIIEPLRFAVHFHPAHFADLVKSGLSEAMIRAAGIYSLAPCDIEFFVSGKRAEAVTSALCFPYQGADFARVKLFPPIGSQKYSQPPGTSARLYAPFPVEQGELYVVEGEKKTLAARQAGLNAVGIGGVWSWVAHGNPIDDLDLIDWERDVTIVGDSDIWSRMDLLRPLYALGRQLQERGASVFFVELPQEGNKMGLDDYLVAGGQLDDLDGHIIGSKFFNSQRVWYSHWKIEKAVAAVRKEMTL